MVNIGSVCFGIASITPVTAKASNGMHKLKLISLCQSYSEPTLELRDLNVSDFSHCPDFENQAKNPEIVRSNVAMPI